MSPEPLPHRRPETELLLCCARTRMEPKTAERVRLLLREKIDWDSLLQAAFHHGVLPLLCQNLNNLCPDDIPKVVMNQLKNAFHAVARRNLYLTGELLRLLILFQGYGIRALPFKGPVLAAVAYGNPSLRHFGDLDVLMPRDDILKAKEVLMSLGYHAKLDLTTSEEAAYLQSHHDYKFVRLNDGLIVELQWGVTQWSFAFPIDFEDLWKHREEVSLAGTTVCNLSLEDSLLILCVHGTKHRWGQLKWICDIAELVDGYQEEIDWHRFMDRACLQGGERMLLLGLFLAHDLLGAALSGNVLKKVHDDRHIRCLASGVRTWLFREIAHPVRLRDERPFFYLQARERLSDKVALVWKYFPEYFLRAIGRMKKIVHSYHYSRSSALALISLDLFS